MPVQFRPRKTAGRQLKLLPKTSCSWCIDGIPPSAPETICQACHEKFKSLLCRPSWNKRFRLARLSLNPICQVCQEVPSLIVDHIKTWATRPDLFWNEDNTQCLCPQCHNEKTNREDGGTFKVSSKK